VEIIQSGENSSLYHLPQYTLSFEVTPLVTKEVKLIKFELENFSFSTAEFLFTVDQECVCHYFVALRGTQSLSFKEIKAQ
jgi:hypothetical protein